MGLVVVPGLMPIPSDHRYPDPQSSYSLLILFPLHIVAHVCIVSNKSYIFPLFLPIGLIVFLSKKEKYLILILVNFFAKRIFNTLESGKFCRDFPF